MTRLAKDRDTQLTSDEIVEQALRQFDTGGTEPSIRSLASELQVAPSAIYHHFPSRAAIIRGAVDRVWNESFVEMLKLVPKPLDVDPREVLVAAGIATRRAWLAHYSLAPYLTANPEADEFTRNSLGLMAILLERLGLEGDAAAAAFHSYTSFMIGSVLFAASRLVANDQLGPVEQPFRLDYDPSVERQTTDATRKALDEVMELSIVDPERDEELYAWGLRRLVDSLVAPD